MADAFRNLLLAAGEIASPIARAQVAMVAQGPDALFLLWNADLDDFSGPSGTGSWRSPPPGSLPLWYAAYPTGPGRGPRSGAPSPWRPPRTAPTLQASRGMGPLRRVGVELDVPPAAHV